MHLHRLLHCCCLFLVVLLLLGLILFLGVLPAAAALGTPLSVTEGLLLIALTLAAMFLIWRKGICEC